ncbi:MAG TPA: DUF4406 domain-containing protein, partial [Candidatus Paceibacterota bacterium]
MSDFRFEPGYELEYQVDPHGEIEIVFTHDVQESVPEVNLSDIKRCYIAGPMRGLPLFNFPCFHHAADTLRILGFEVWSPAEKDEQSGFNPATDEAKPLIH